MNWMERIAQRFRDKERAMEEKKHEKATSARGPAVRFRIIGKGRKRKLVAIKSKR